MPEPNEQPAAGNESASSQTAEEIAAAAATAAADEAGAGEGSGGDEGGGDAPAPAAAADAAPVFPEEGFKSAEDRDAFLESLPEPQLAAALVHYQQHGEWPKADVAAGDDAGAGDGANLDDEAGATALATADLFKFTENADAETFAAEADKYLETVEITPELQTILERKDAQIGELTGKISANPLLADETAVETMGAFDKLVTFKLDPDLQVHVPDTEGVIRLLETKYSNELPRLIQDINSQPSTKYQGYTRLMEYVRDGFDLSPQSMVQLNYFLDNNGEFPVPAYTPPGVHPTLADAYWNAPDRSDLDTKIEQAQFTLTKDPDATEQEKADAAAALRGINVRLDREQKGINADKTTRANERKNAEAVNREIFVEGEKAFYGTSTALLSQFSEKLTKALPMLDENGSGLTGLSVATLVEKALTDDQYHSKFAQAQLTKLGVQFDWKRGRAELDRLWDVELQIVALQKQRANERAITNAQAKKDGIVLALQNLETELSGKIVSRIVTGNAAKVAKQMAVAPKTAAVKTKARGEGVGGGNAATDDWDKMSLEEVEERLKKLSPAAAAVRGDLSGYDR